MTDKEFIGFLNNLEDKSQHVCKINICNFKPYDPKPETERIDVTVADMIDLINRQQKELEELNVELVGIRGACNSYKMHYDNAQTEIENARVSVKSYKGKYESAVRAAKEYQSVIAEKDAEIERLKEDNEYLNDCV